MTSVSKLTSTIAELLEAEMRSHQRSALTSIAGGALAAVLAIAGLGFLLAAGFLAALRVMPAPLAALMMGVVAVGLAWVTPYAKAWFAKGKSKKKEEDEEDVAKAKAQLLQAIDEIDLLLPLRRQPLLTVAVAAIAGGVLGASAESLGNAATFIRTVASFLKPLLDRHNQAASSPASEPQENNERPPEANSAA